MKACLPGSDLYKNGLISTKVKGIEIHVNHVENKSYFKFV